MLGTDFAATLRAAQGGDSAAFLRLWRDGNVAVVRYLRVVGAPDPYAAAHDAWAIVVGGLRTFTGDETAWRVWILTCARRCAGGRPVRHPGELLAAEVVVHRGVNDTIAAISELPLGQGEILVLRLVGELPVAAVADVVGTDVVAVHRSEDKAIERLGAERELIAWSLAAPPLPLELAGERDALAAFRSQSRRTPQAAGTTRVIALGSLGSVRGTSTRTALGRSRTALVGIAALSATMMSLGGLSAAAYMGALPDGVQEVMHQVIGAPAPGATSPGGSVASVPSGSPTGSLATTRAAIGLCRAWSADQAKGVSAARSTAFRRLADAAGGPAMVDPYCALVTKGQPPSSTGAPHPDRTATGSPTHPTRTKTPMPGKQKTAPPKTAQPKTAPPKTGTTTGTAKTATPRTATPRTATPRTATPRTATPKPAHGATAPSSSTPRSASTPQGAVTSHAAGQGQAAVSQGR